MKKILAAFFCVASAIAVCGDNEVSLSAVASDFLKNLEKNGILQTYSSDISLEFCNFLAYAVRNCVEAKVPIRIVSTKTQEIVMSSTLYEGTNSLIMTIPELEGEAGLEKIFELAKDTIEKANPNVIIIDLCGAGGNSMDCHDTLLKNLEQLKQPIFLIVNSETCALAESAAYELKKKNAVILGAITSGCQGTFKKIEMKNNLELYLPSIHTEPIKPDIALDTAQKEERQKMAAELATAMLVMQKHIAK